MRAPLRTTLVSLGIVVAVAAVYARVLDFDFVNYDDPGYVTENRMVQRGLTPEGLVWAFTTDAMVGWQPLTWLSHMLDRELYGPDPAGHHATSVLLHALNALLVFLVLRSLTGAVWRSAIVAALFALHPLRVESVAWVAERKDVLSVFFALLALAAYGSYARRGGAGRMALVALLLLMGLMAKPILVTFPAVLLLLDYWPLRRARSLAALPGLLREKLPLIAVAFAFSVVTLVVQQPAMGVGVEPIPLHLRGANALSAYVSYLELTLWPSGLSVLYPHPYQATAGGAPLGAVRVAMAAAVLATLSLLCVWRVRRGYAAVGWLWFLGTLVPVIGIIQVGQQAFADRYTYLPHLGLLIAIVWGGAELVTPLWRRSALARALVGAGVVALLSVQAGVTWRQAGHWRDSVSLFERGLVNAPRNSTVHVNLGRALRDAGRTEDALLFLRRAVELGPGNPSAYNNLVFTLLGASRLEEAFAVYGEWEAAMPRSGLDPRIVKITRPAFHALGAALQAKGRHPEAATIYARSIELGVPSANAENLLGTALEAHGKRAEAMAHYERALALRPGHRAAFLNLERLLQAERDQ